MDFHYLGRVSFADGLARQNELVEQRRRGLIADTILLLEHEPVYTIGRTRDRSSLRDPDSLPFPVVETNRGGQATFHGPGQLVGYLILDLNDYGRDLHRYLRQIESALIGYATSLGLSTGRREGLTGVWIGPRKLASIGIGVRHWIAMHGFGLNVTRDLSGYESIIPCGISDVRMTSLAEELDLGISVAEVAAAIPEFILESLRALRTTGSVLQDPSEP
jgi:lipoyl(octanoyl) transferase